MGLADDEECFLWMLQWEGGSLLQEMGDSVIVGGPRQEERREEKSRAEKLSILVPGSQRKTKTTQEQEA